MTAAAGRFGSLRFKLFLLLAGPLLVALTAGLGDWSSALRPSEATELARREQRLVNTFEALLAEVSRVASTALADSPRVAWTGARLRPGALARRVEGIGLLGPDLEFISWEGMPADPPPWLAEAGRPDWTVRVDGVRTRLLARAGPDGRGRLALVSFVVDSTLDDLSFRHLLPNDLRTGVQIDIEFGAPEGTDGPGPGLVPLRSPSGDLLAVANLAPASPAWRAKRTGDVARAWATVLFLALLAFLFDWKAICARPSGLLLAAAAIAAGRGLALWQHVTGGLLSRELGAASLYGSSKLWGLLQSPADLLLTGAAIYLACVATRVWCSRPGARGMLERWIAGLAAAGTTLVVSDMATSLARNSRVPLLERPAPFEWDVRLVLWLALVLSILGASELWASLWTSRRAHARAGGPAPVPVALVLVVLSAGASMLLQRQSERLAVEQVDSELAPLVLEQAERRRLALTEALQEVVDRYEHREDPGGSHPEFLAYRHWVGSELFHRRYKSSLDFYTAEGEPLDHFGFGMPPLDEAIPSVGGGLEQAGVKEEWMDDMAAQPWLLHAEAPLVVGDEVVGYVVGHVLDEPDNLPFLPWSQTYLAALGPGAPRAAAQAPGGGLQYVLYGALGEIDLTTLLQPPAETGELREAAARGGTLRVAAGDERYMALALEEDGGRLHLLLLPQLTLAGRLGAIVRLSLLGLSVLVVLALLTRAFRSGGLRGLVPLLRGSFYRKLLAALLLASIAPLVGLALFLRGYLEGRGDAALVSSATQLVSTVQRVVEDYSVEEIEGETGLTDGVLYWLRRIVGQEIHVYRDGRLQASSTRELFDSGLLPPRLDGEVQRRLVDEGLPHLVVPMSIGSTDILVAYAPVRRSGDPPSRMTVAVPLVLEQRQIARALSRVGEMILLATVALVGLLAVAAALLARTVARPVRDLVAATAEIAAGDYATRLEPATEDEVAELVHGFNTMASALARQRADLERRRDYIETLLRHAPTGVISLDAGNRVVTLNPAATELLPSVRLQVGDDLNAVLADSREFEPLSRGLREARAGEPVDVDLVGDEPRRLRGVRVELRKTDGERFGTLILLEDVTDLMRSNQLAAWAEMARAIAHEIKNPLTPIQLSTEHLARLLADRPEKPTEEEQACLETIIKQVRALYDIAGEFSAYAKLPVLAPEPIDPVAFMRGVVAPYRAAKPTGITIAESYGETTSIAADPKVLSRAVINLIENALQAMPDGGTLTVGVDAGERDSRVALSVADTGPGLGREVRRRLFEPYFSTKSSGTGLGLAIARRVVEAHGGTIEVASAPERGTVFRIYLPAHAA
jgi:signal transduction histidine kinase